MPNDFNHAKLVRVVTLMKYLTGAVSLDSLPKTLIGNKTKTKRRFFESSKAGKKWA